MVWYFFYVRTHSFFLFRMISNNSVAVQKTCTSRAHTKAFCFPPLMYLVLVPVNDTIQFTCATCTDSKSVLDCCFVGHCVVTWFNGHACLVHNKWHVCVVMQSKCQ